MAEASEASDVVDGEVLGDEADVVVRKGGLAVGVGDSAHNRRRSM